MPATTFSTIGQFGVGVCVVNKNNDYEQYKLESTAGGSVTEQKDTETGHGQDKRCTKIICYLREDESAYHTFSCVYPSSANAVPQLAVLCALFLRAVLKGQIDINQIMSIDNVYVFGGDSDGEEGQCQHFASDCGRVVKVQGMGIKVKHFSV